MRKPLTLWEKEKSGRSRTSRTGRYGDDVSAVVQYLERGNS